VYVYGFINKWVVYTKKEDGEILQKRKEGVKRGVNIIRREGRRL